MTGDDRKTWDAGWCGPRKTVQRLGLTLNLWERIKTVAPQAWQISIRPGISNFGLLAMRRRRSISAAR
jgi:hypothetical protein